MTQLNSLDHFDIQLNIETNSYWFVSDKNTLYYVTFSVYSDLLGVDFPVYNMSLYRTLRTDKKIKSDGVKVKNTVLHILSLFFNNNQNALVAVYDENDGRQECRKRLFKNWLFSIKDQLNLCIHEGTFDENEVKSHCILVYTKHNENEEGLYECFKDLIENNFFITNY